MVNVQTLLEDPWNMSLGSVSAAPGLQEFLCNKMCEVF